LQDLLETAAATVQGEQDNCAIWFEGLEVEGECAMELTSLQARIHSTGGAFPSGSKALTRGRHQALCPARVLDLFTSEPT
jgi:hypothetical protein